MDAVQTSDKGRWFLNFLGALFSFFVCVFSFFGTIGVVFLGEVVFGYSIL